MFSALRSAQPRPRATLPVALFVLTLALAGLLAWEARGEVRSHQASAARALHDYAAFAARSVLDDADAALDRELGAAFAPATAAKAASPSEALAGPEVIAGSSAAVLRCPGAPAERTLFRVDLRDGGLATAGAPASDALRAFLRGVPAHARSAYVASARYAALVGEGAAAGMVAVYGVKYAPYGAPAGAYGFVTCPAAFARYFGAAAARYAPEAGGAPLLSLGAAADGAPGGVPGGAPGGAFFATEGWPAAAGDTLARRAFHGFTVRAGLAPEARRRLVVGPAGRSRLPALLALLALTGGTALVALMQLRRAQELARLRADFTSSVSHELRTPLAQILLFGETLALGRARTEGERRLAAGTIVQEARRLIQMVENVLHQARAERGVALALNPAPAALGPLVRSVVESFAPVAAAALATVHVDALGPDGDALVARADPAAVRQVLLNLLDNAVKYGPAGQAVRVGALRAGDSARLWVEDGGPGVPARQRERIWGAYVRLAPRGPAAGASGAVRAAPGSGLGLSVVREIARRSGGDAWVEEGAAGGARFVVELPLWEGGPTSVLDAPELPHSA